MLTILTVTQKGLGQTAGKSLVSCWPLCVWAAAAAEGLGNAQCIGHIMTTDAGLGGAWRESGHSRSPARTAEAAVLSLQTGLNITTYRLIDGKGRRKDQVPHPLRLMGSMAPGTDSMAAFNSPVLYH